MNIHKKLNVTLLGLSLGLLAFTYLYWMTVCSQNPCDYYTITKYIEPLEYAGFVLSAFFFFFLILPVHYFESWLKRIFSWAFPLALISVILTENGGGVMSFSKADIVVVNGILWGVVTLLFVFYTWRKIRSNKVAGE